MIERRRFKEPVTRQWMMAQATINPDSKCWEWIGSKGHFGYGKVYFHGRYEKTHRVAYFLWNDAWPDGLVVRHRCDNPPCFNPGHLLPGTPMDNVRDCIAKGRFRRSTKGGPSHHSAKLNEDQVRMIRASKESEKWATLFKISKVTVWRVRQGISHGSVSD